MAGISESLDAHHAQLEAQLAEVLSAARAADWRSYRARFAALRAGVLDHIAFEQLELFPELARVLGSDVEIHALREEHERLCRHFETLAAAAPEYDPEGCMGELEALGSLIREHHERELQVCYPVSDRRLGGDVGLEQSARAIASRARAAHAGFHAKPPVDALDLRGLQPPEPIVRIFQALERSPGEPLRAILPHEPVPLYALLRERGFRYAGEMRPDGGYELLIERA